MATSFVTARSADSTFSPPAGPFSRNQAPGTADRVRIVIADDAPIEVEGLRKFMSSRPSLWVAGRASVGAEVERLVRELESDTLLIVAPRKPAMSPLRKTAPPARTDFGLTPRELAITKRVAQGSSNKEMGEEFKISLRTVKHHLTNIFDKLGLCSRLQLAVFAFEHGLVNPTED